MSPDICSAKTILNQVIPLKVQIVSYTWFRIHGFINTSFQLKKPLRTMYSSEGLHTYGALIRPFDMEQIVVHIKQGNIETKHDERIIGIKHNLVLPYTDKTNYTGSQQSLYFA